MFRKLIVVGILALLSACGEPSAPRSPGIEPLNPGTYALETVNGATLPFLKEQSAAERIEVVTGLLTLRPDRTYHGEIIEQRTGAEATDSLKKVSDGTFSVVANNLTFKESGSGAVHRGTIDGYRISATLGDVTFRFVKE